MALGDLPGLNVKISTDTSGLSAGLKTSSSRLDKFRTKVDDAGTRLIKFGAAASIAGGALAGMKLVSVTREFNKLSAGLITATGSSEGADKAFSALQDFAATTPSTLQDVTDAFIKLNNLGLGPSERALTSYGDTASAMGKDLMQFIEAVADASTAEFERLKEFGIRAKNQGDTIAFTFKGVTTTVANNAAAIEEHLIRLGEVNFAGAMQRRMETLDGALSNLGDSWDKLFLTVSNAGVGSIIEDAARMGIEALDELSAEIESGQLPAQMEAIGSRFDAFGEDFANLFKGMGDVAGNEFRFIADVGDNTVDLLVDSFSDFPENMRAIIQLAGVEVGALGHIFSASAEFAVQAYTVKLASLIDKAVVIGEAIAKGLNPLNSTTDILAGIEQEFARIDQVAMETTDGFAALLEAQINAGIIARQDSIVAIMTERDAALESFDAQMAAADALRSKFDEANAARLAAGGDRLAEFGGNAGGVDGATEDGGVGSGVNEEQNRLDALMERFETEKLVKEEHLQALEDLDKIFAIQGYATDAEQKAIKEELEKDHMDKLKGIRGRGMTDIQNLSNQMMQGDLQSTAKFLTQMSSGMASHSKKMFKLNQVAGIADAGISMYQGIAAGLKLGYPMAIPAVAFAAAQGAAAIQGIRSQSFGGGGASAATVAAPAAAPQAAPQQNSGGDGGGSGRIINVTGIAPDTLITGRMMIDLINEAEADGARLVISR
jgi:hypothetical protein